MVGSDLLVANPGEMGTTRLRTAGLLGFHHTTPTV